MPFLIRRSLASPLVKRLIACVLLFPFAAATAYAQVCSGDVTLNTQAAVNAFDCVEVTGNLRVDGDNISNLDGLSELTTVGGDVVISNNDALTNVDGLGNLTSIGNIPNGDLIISGNDELKDLNGLSNLTSINGLTISRNAKLTNLSGLSGLSGSVFGDVNISNNDTLESLEGLGGLADADFLIISNNDALESLEGLSLSNVLFNVQISGNDALQSLEGLPSITLYFGDVTISDNDALQSLRGFNFTFSSLSSAYLMVRDNDALSQCCELFPFLTSAGFHGIVVIENNAEGCNSETQVIEAGSCDASDCAITSLTESDPFVGNDDHGRVDVTFDNPDGLTEIAFTKFENFGLVQGQIAPAPSSISETNGRPTLSFANAPEQIALTLRQANLEVADAAYFAVARSACPYAEDGLLETDFDPPVSFDALMDDHAPATLTFEGAYPNPTRESATIGLALPEKAEVTVSVYDVMGRRVAVLAQQVFTAGRHEVRWDGHADSGHHLASGLYLIRLEADGQVRTGRVTVVR